MMATSFNFVSAKATTPDVLVCVGRE